jgi:cystathionine gamma-synthase/cystathionine gamma-lyase
MRFETKAIHSGQQPDTSTGAVIVPVFQTSTFQQEAVGKHKGYEYSRTGNPTRTALELCLAELEGGKFGLAFSSGVAATAAVFSLFGKGTHIVLGDDLYGGTYRLVEKVFKKWGLSSTYEDVDNIESFRKAITAKTRLVWIESPTNPLLKVIDIKRLAKITREKKVLLAVDNTFASPYFQNPIALGADVVVHSTTKYINGHSDIVGGAVVVNDEAIYNQLKFYQNAAGAVPGPWDCWLTLRGVRTLAVRMREHESNAQYLAKFLSKHKKVAKVYYPGLKGTRGYKIASGQMLGFGGMLSFEIKGDFAAVEKFFSGLKIFLLAESLGGVESLVCYPAKMTHGSMPEKERLKRGIKNNLIRVSIGLENKEDLKDDLEQALLQVT